MIKKAKFKNYLHRLRENIVDGNENRTKLDSGEVVMSCMPTSKTLYDGNTDFKQFVDKPFFRENDWKEFWKTCEEYFPLHSVHGNGRSKDGIIQSERNQWHHASFDRYFKEIGPNFPKCLEGKKVLEIGYGYGGAGLELIDKYKADYIGIDYNRVNTDLPKDRFLTIGKSGIPRRLMSRKFDFIFSVNVFQHLTKQQRLDYMKQAAQVLSDDGTFLFTVNQWNPKVNNGVPAKGYATYFFSAVTSIESEEEVYEMLNEAGLKCQRRDVLCTTADDQHNLCVRYIVSKQ